MSIVKKAALAATVVGGFAAISAPASAATFAFAPGGSSPSTGFTVVNTFDSAEGLTGANFLIKTPPSDSEGAPPANSSPAGTSYLSVLGDGFATYVFTNRVSSFQFDWGSIDDFNTLIFVSNLGGEVVVPGTDFTTPANGNQILPGTNGLFTVTGDAGETFSQVTFLSSVNSFEVDNLAVSGIVPEPATWAMMIGGFGFVGSAMRRRRARTTVSFA